MAKKTKGNKKPIKPYFQWEVTDHLTKQALAKFIPADVWQAITQGRVELSKVRKHDDRCEKCGHYKFDFFTKVAPKDGEIDAKVIGCEGCQKFITVYLNERTHGNTPLHAYQIREGMTSYVSVCKVCGHRATITTAHKTPEQVAEAKKHECRRGR